MASGPITTPWKVTGYSPTKGSKVSAIDGALYSIGNICIGYLLVTVSSTMQSTNEILASGLPAPKSVMQLPFLCVYGSNNGKVGRCSINATGSLVTWYTLTPVASEVYLIPICYVTK